MGFATLAGMPTLDWIGKNAVVGHHKDMPYRLIKCDKDFSAGEAGEGNLLIEGDNLHALKALLPYYGANGRAMDPARVSALPLGSFIARNQMTGGMLAGKLF